MSDLKQGHPYKGSRYYLHLVVGKRASLGYALYPKEKMKTAIFAVLPYVVVSTEAVLHIFFG